VEAVNFNAPGQGVIAGEASAVEAAMTQARQLGAKRALPLPVSVPSHCSLMKGAARQLAAELETLIRPAGYFRVKAKRLKNVIEFIVERYRNLETMIEQDCDKLRQELLEVNGVGPETADSILLYAANKPTFVIDAYTARIAKRHGWIEPEADYHALKEFFESQLEKETELFNEYHALIVQVGKDYCKPTPKCDGCPLQPMIADSGLVNFGDH
jgi:endonuclease III-like uncharacterized protein